MNAEGDITPAWFGAETFVAMEDGSFEEIQYVSVGRKIQTIDAATLSVSTRRVTAIATHDAVPTLHIYYRVEADQELPLETTQESSFWINDGRFVAALNLVAGDSIRTASGRPAIVECVVPTGYSIDVRKLVVEGLDCYLVGSQRLVICSPLNR